MKDQRTILLEKLLIPGVLKDLEDLNPSKTEYETKRIKLMELALEYHERTGERYPFTLIQWSTYLE